MISRGELEIDLEPQGNRHRVWIMLDEPVMDTDTLPDNSPEASREDTYASEVVTLRERVKSLEELATYHRGQLTEKDRQLQEVLASLGSAQRTAEQFSKAMPALQEPSPEAKSRRWWIFR